MQARSSSWSASRSSWARSVVLLLCIAFGCFLPPRSLHAQTESGQTVSSLSEQTLKIRLQKVDELLRNLESNSPRRLQQVSDIESRLTQVQELLRLSRIDIETWKQRSAEASAARESYDLALQMMQSSYARLDQKFKRLLEAWEKYKAEMANQVLQLKEERDRAQCIARLTPWLVVAAVVVTYIVTR